MTNTISAAELLSHIRNLTEAVEIISKPLASRTPADYGRIQVLVSYVRDSLLQQGVTDVVVETEQ